MVELMFGNPLKAFAEGSELSQQMQRSKMQTEAQGMQNEAAGMALQQAKWQMPAQEALYNLSQKENQTYDDYNELMRRYPMLSETVKPALSSLNTEQQQAASRQLSGIVAAMNNGRYDVASNLISEASAAQGNAGNKQGEKIFRDFGELVKLNPREFRTASNLIYSQLDPTGFQNVINQSKAMNEMAVQQQELIVKQQNAQTDALKTQGQLNKWANESEQGAIRNSIDQQKLSSEGNLKRLPAEKIQPYFDAADNATAMLNELDGMEKVINDIAPDLTNSQYLNNLQNKIK